MTKHQIIAKEIFHIGKGYISMINAWNIAKESIWLK